MFLTLLTHVYACHCRSIIFIYMLYDRWQGLMHWNVPWGYHWCRQISVDSDKLFLARQAKYLGLWVRNDLSWDDHILELCRKMYYYFHMFRRLRKFLPSALLLNIYKTYVQSKIDYGLSIGGCTTEVNLNRVQRIQNLLARIICDNFDYIHSRGIDLVRS